MTPASAVVMNVQWLEKSLLNLLEAKGHMLQQIKQIKKTI
jgi:hypothetical protein